MYPDCGRRWAARHIPELLDAAGYKVRTVGSSVGAAVGSATHSGAAYIMGTKIDTGTLGNKTEADQRALASLDERIAAEECRWDDTTGNLNTAQKQVIRQLAVFRRDVAPVIKPVAVEQRITKQFSDTIEVSGQADICEDGTILDLKTGVMRRSNAAQYGTYSLLRRSDDHEVGRLAEIYIPRARLTKAQPEPTIHEYPVEAAENAAFGIIKRIGADIEAFRVDGDPSVFMANPASMLCSERYCPAFNTMFCRLHKGA